MLLHLIFLTLFPWKKESILESVVRFSAEDPCTIIGFSCVHYPQPAKFQLVQQCNTQLQSFIFLFFLNVHPLVAVWSSCLNLFYFPLPPLITQTILRVRSALCYKTIQGSLHCSPYETIHSFPCVFLFYHIISADH